MRTTLFRVASFLIVGSVLAAVPSAALARAQQTAVSGDQQAMVSGPPASVQRAGKWTIVTNAPLTGTFAFSGDGVSLAGTLTRVVSVKIDSGNNGILWGTVNYVDSRTGVTCAGFNHGRLINNFLTGNVVASCTDGSLLRGTLQDTDITYDAHGTLSAVTTHFTGTILRSNA